MIEQSYGAMGVGVMKSTIEHKKAGMGCFARVEFRKRMVIGCCSRTLVYVDLYGEKDLDRRYNKGG